MNANIKFDIFLFKKYHYSITMVTFTDNDNAKLTALHQYKKKNIKGLEFEVGFGTHITQSTFMNVLKELKSSIDIHQYTFSKSTTLDISVYENEHSKNLNLRFTLNGKDAISNYCSLNELSTLDHDVLYKKINKFTAEDGDISPYSIGDETKLFINDYDLRYNLKKELSLDKKTLSFEDIEANKEWTRYNRLLSNRGNRFVKLYKTFRLKNRYSFETADGQIRFDLTVVQSSHTRIHNGKIRQIPVQEFIDSKLLEQDKTFEIEIELFPNVDNMGPYTDYKENIESDIDRVLKSIQHYPHLMSKDESRDVLHVYKALLESYVQDTIRQKETILEVVRERNRAFASGNNVKVVELDEQYEESIYYNNIKNKNITALSNKLNYQKKKEFSIGPKPVSIEMKHIQSNTRDTMIGSEVYSVTDKADGLGKLLYIVGLDHLNEEEQETYGDYQGHIYMIDSNDIIYATGYHTWDSELYNTLMNGEYINHNLNMEKVSWFKAYDLYYENSQSTMHLSLLSDNMDTDTRISRLNTIILKLEQSSTYYGEPYSNIDKTNPELLMISVKHFEIGRGIDLFKKSANVWNEFIQGRSPYKYDGLIYTPINRPVGYSHSVDYDIEVGKTWFMNIKWKPPYENTIDFVVKELKEKVASYGGSVLEKAKVDFIQGAETGTYNKYKTYYLEVGKNEYRYEDPCQSQLRDYKPAPKNINSRYLSTPFKPTTPYNETAYIAKIMMEKDYVVGNEWKLYEDGSGGEWEPTNDIIRDNTIVEFSYKHYSKDDPRYVDNPECRWVPLRTREDKTYKYRRGIKKQKELYQLLSAFIEKMKSSNTRLNREDTEQLRKLTDVIYSVPNLIRKETIIKTLQIQENIQKIERYYPDYSFIKTREVSRLIAYGNDYKTANNIWKTIHNPITENMITTGENIPVELDTIDKYYRKDVSVKRAKSITIPLQKFHNKIKELLIKGVSTQIRKDIEGVNIHLLDLATGKGGDISKWKHNNINHVVGIDIVRDNIYNEIDGACVRRQHILKNSPDMNITFMVGDIRRNIANGDSFTEPLSIKIWRDLWNTRNQYDLITCMFGIHYVFSDETTLDHFITNIDENIKPGGYFVGTCLDGQMVFDRFKDSMFGEYIRGEKEGKVIWKLQKKYTNEEFPENSASLDMKVSVYMNSINQEITEYLVNFNYLVKKLKEKNIELIPSGLCRDLILSLACEGGFKSIYDKMIGVREFNTVVKGLSIAEKELSFLTRYFIFRKKT